jgi:DNA invertase Pin-like site-specific DNA recombinase
MKYVGYFRVSTKKQEKSGLGLEAQENDVRRFAREHGQLIAEFTDVISGKSSKIRQLDCALKLAKAEKATLLVAKLDRFSRKVSFISWLLEQKVDLCVVEMPTASTFQLHIYAALAQEERRLISDRTKSALQAAKARGVVLGKSSEQRSFENSSNAFEFAHNTLALVRSFRESGDGYTLISRKLNEMGVESFRGKRFHPSTVRNMVMYLVAANRA